MITLPAITPTAAPFTITIPGDPANYSILILSNESAFDLAVQYAGQSKQIPAWTADYLALTGNQSVISVVTTQNLPQVVQPNATLTLNLYSVTEQQPSLAQYPLPLTRNIQVYGQSQEVGFFDLQDSLTNDVTLPPDAQSILISITNALVKHILVEGKTAPFPGAVAPIYLDEDNPPNPVSCAVAPGASPVITIKVTATLGAGDIYFMQVVALSFPAQTGSVIAASTPISVAAHNNFGVIITTSTGSPANAGSFVWNSQLLYGFNISYVVGVAVANSQGYQLRLVGATSGAFLILTAIAALASVGCFGAIVESYPFPRNLAAYGFTPGETIDINFIFGATGDDAIFTGVVEC